MTKTPSPIQDLIAFLDHSPTAWHAVNNVAKHLITHQFIELSESERWSLKPGQNYFVQRNGSSLCAFKLPKDKPKRVKLLASHTDSPGFKIKPNPEIRRQGAILLSTEIYGSPLLTSWLNRDLGIAGRISVSDKSGKIDEKLVTLTNYPLTIPQLAIHLDRDVNDKGPLLNKQEHYHALAALEIDFKSPDSYLETILKENYTFERLLGYDLFLFPIEKGRLIGYKNQLVASYRLDSLASVHAILHALCQPKTVLGDAIQMVIFWDNEEIGSHTAHGAESPFFNQTLERMLSALGGDREDYFCTLNNSICVSVDLAHAVNPNYPEKHDSNHLPRLGKGVVIKHNAQQRYATDGRSVVPIQMVADVAKISLQNFVSRNDTPCGTTIGPLHACSTGMPTVDIGCGQLSMHSSREIISCEDHLAMCNLLQRVLES